MRCVCLYCALFLETHVQGFYFVSEIYSCKKAGVFVEAASSCTQTAHRTTECVLHRLMCPSVWIRPAPFCCYEKQKRIRDYNCVRGIHTLL